MLKTLQANWRTTTVAILAALSALLDAGIKLFDDDPLTEPDWALVVGLIVVAIGLLRARDDVVTSEQSKP